MNIDQEKIEKAVIEESVAALVDQYTTGADRGDSLRFEIKKRVEELIKAAIDERVTSILVAGVNGLTFPMTNSFGEKKQPDKTLREYIDSMIQAFLQEHVDYEGRTKSPGWGSRDSETRICFLIRKEISKHIEDSVKTAGNTIKTQMSSIIGGIVKSGIDEAVQKLR